MVLIIVMGGNVIVFFHGGVSLFTGIAHYYNSSNYLSMCASACYYRAEAIQYIWRRGKVELNHHGCSSVGQNAGV